MAGKRETDREREREEEEEEEREKEISLIVAAETTDFLWWQER